MLRLIEARRGKAGATGARVSSFYVAMGAALACWLTLLGLAGFVDLPVAQAAETCPNEALRLESTPNPEIAHSLNPGAHLPFSTQLPDCRAYELTTPAYKEGFGPRAVGAVSGDGSHVFYQTLSVLAGGEGSSLGGGNGTLYELTRTSRGWTVSSLQPSALRFPAQSIEDSNVNSGRTLWALREPSQSIYAWDLYAREPGGSLVRIGPMVPPSITGPVAGNSGERGGGSKSSVVGASSDLSRVLFEVTGPTDPSETSYLWPGDTTSTAITNNQSLYEYAGTDNTHPELVGVDGEGHLLGNCGTLLGSEGNRYNAVSRDGETIFFTVRGPEESCAGPPAVDEVWARIGRSASVPISEPTAGQCVKCFTSHTSPAVAEKGAEFVGASEDGAKVFFATEQELFSAHGGLANVQEGENLYEYVFGAPNKEHIVLVSGGATGHEVRKPEVQGVVRISEDGSHVYFVAKAALTGPNAEGRSPTVGEDNLYVFERDAAYPAGRTGFVATLSTGDNQDWQKEDARPVQATPDGRFLAFASKADLTPDDTSASTVNQIFEYDAQKEVLVRVSAGQCPNQEAACGPGEINRFNNDGNSSEKNDSATFERRLFDLEEGPKIEGFRLGLSDDGSYVFFTSSDGLTPQAINAEPGTVIATWEGVKRYALNVYEYHSRVGQSDSIADGNVYLISDGQDVTTGQAGVSRVKFYGTNNTGTDTFIGTGDPLVAQDADTQVDIYDARVDGGFPAPVTPAGCEGETCLPGSMTARSVALPGSSLAPGGGNLLSFAGPTVQPFGGVPQRVNAKPRALTQRQKLVKALKACKKERVRKKRARCETLARKRYASGKASIKASGVRRGQ